MFEKLTLSELLTDCPVCRGPLVKPTRFRIESAGAEEYPLVCARHLAPRWAAKSLRQQAVMHAAERIMLNRGWKPGDELRRPTRRFALEPAPRTPAERFNARWLDGTTILVAVLLGVLVWAAAAAWCIEQIARWVA